MRGLIDINIHIETFECPGEAVKKLPFCLLTTLTTPLILLMSQIRRGGEKEKEETQTDRDRDSLKGNP